MLQQILRDMYIEPELLAELSEEQKQVLFVKMREEQVRRWKEREEDNRQPSSHKSPKSGRKKVNFLQGRDGKEWVWVMGDHKADRTISQIMEAEAQEKALKQAEKEAAEMRRKEEAEWRKKMEEEKKKLEKQKLETELMIKRKKEEAALYQSIKEAQLAAQKLEEEKRKKDLEEKKKLEELKVVTERQRRKSTEKYDHMRHRRSSEIYIRWKEMRVALERTAEESSQEVEASWVEQEKKAKEAEMKMRELARKAREEYKESIKRTSKLILAAKAFGQVQNAGTEKPPVPPKKHLQPGKSSIKRWNNRPPRPPNRDAVITWFKEEERGRGAGLDCDMEKIANWFHGIINRSEAEKLLGEKAVGTFLMRVSERVWGYTISYKGQDRVKHFLIDTGEGGYQFLGASQMQHNSLADLVKFHRDNPITISGEEKLLFDCGQTVDPPDYWELFHSNKSESTSL